MEKLIVERALGAARQGVRLFPANPLDKTPYISGWVHKATTDENQIEDWWQRWPEALLAAPTGSANGFFVLDVDVAEGKEGMQSLDDLQRTYGLIACSQVVRTPTGGLHFYFLLPEKVVIPNSVSKIATHIDIRGESGYIIYPGSIRPQGEYCIISDWGMA